MARHAQRRDDARPEQDRAPGRDRRRLRADRLLALQRALHAADLRRAAELVAPGCGTASTTARSRASSSRSRRSTSRRSRGNLPSAPALMGNTVALEAGVDARALAHFMMELFEEAGLPPGVINFVPGSGAEVGDAGARAPATSPASTSPAPPRCSRAVADDRRQHRALPQLSAHRRRDRRQGLRLRASLGRVAALVTALVRGAFEYQGQKCSAASRAYVPEVAVARGRERLATAVARSRWATPADFAQLHGRGDRRALVRTHRRLHRRGEEVDERE